MLRGMEVGESVVWRRDEFNQWLFENGMSEHMACEDKAEGCGDRPGHASLCNAVYGTLLRDASNGATRAK